MSKIKKEVAGCMAGLEASQDALSARFLFPEAFIGFQGHFPGKKVLPGVCQIQCVLSMIEKHEHRTIVLKEIVQAKFFSPVAPGEEIACVCTDTRGGASDFLVKAALTKGAQKVADIKLRVCYGA